VHSLRWTGGDKSVGGNDKEKAQDRSNKDTAAERNKRTKKRAEQRKNNKYNQRQEQ
jgi:hypothetical protein